MGATEYWPWITRAILAIASLSILWELRRQRALLIRTGLQRSFAVIVCTAAVTALVAGIEPNPTGWSALRAAVGSLALGGALFGVLRVFVPHAARSLANYESAQRELLDEVHARRAAEVELEEGRLQLETRVAERTRELRSTNRRLEREVAERQRTETALEDRIRLEELMADVAAEFGRQRGENVGEAIEEALESISLQFGFDRATVLERNDSEDAFSCRYEWYGEKLGSARPYREGPSCGAWRGLTDLLANAEPIYLTDLDFLPDDTPALAQIRADGIRGAAVLPLVLAGKLIGIVTFEATQTREWAADMMQCLRFTSELIRDGVHRQRVERQIASQQQDYQAIFQSASDGILVVDEANTVIVDANQTACAMWERMSLAGSHLEDLFVAEDTDNTSEDAGGASVDAGGASVDAGGASVHAGGGDGTRLEIRRASVGVEREFWAEVERIPSEIGGAKRQLVLVRDVSERIESERKQRRLSEQLRQSQKMEALGQLAGGVAHDFNNLLTVILGNAEVLLEELRTLPAIRPDLQLGLEQIETSAERASELTNQLLAFGRRQVMQTEPLDLNQVLAQNESLLARLIGEDIALELRPSPEAPGVVADPGQVHQILLNLLVNARDAMPDGGRILVETAARMEDDPEEPDAQPGLYAILRVRDTGTGISAEVREHVFEPFFTTKPTGKGTGLGLATVHGIARQLGGFARLAETSGRGTTFEVALPAQSEVLTHAASEPAPELLGGRPATILVCEDDTSVRRHTSNVLERAGHRVLSASNGEEALAMARGSRDPVDLLITDVIMPEMNGRKLADRLVAEHPRTAVLYVSGYPADLLAPRGILRDGLAFLGKPFRGRELLERVRELLAQGPEADDTATEPR